MMPAKLKGKFLLTTQLILMASVFYPPMPKSRNFMLLLIGILIFLLASLLFVLAKKDLKNGFTPIPEPKNGALLITEGIYGLIRHPMYLAFILFSTSFCLIKESIFLILTTVSLVIILNLKYRYEDSLLKIKWASAAKYQENIPALIPRFRR